MIDILNMTALELSAAVKEKKISVIESVSAYFDVIEKYDGILHCFNFYNKQQVLTRAAEVQQGIDSGKYTGPLAGVPIAIKDNICTKDMPTTCSSRILDGFVPPYNASVIKKLESEGMIILGKTNTDEFAMGSSTETSYTGATRNPWDTSKTAGGSSGGSAACVAAGLSPLALGSDTGGSVRQPCSFCGITGLKPTYGAVSRYGLIAYASSFDQIGVMGRSAEECAVLYSLICGKDVKDSTCADVSFDLSKAVYPEIKGKRIALPKEFFEGEISADVKNAVLKVGESLSALGAEIEEISLPVLSYAVPAYYIIACAQASSNLARFDSVKFGNRAKDCNSLEEIYIKSRSQGLGSEVKRRIMLGNFVLSEGYYEAFYQKALKASAVIKKAFAEAFKAFDMILAPVTPSTAPELFKKSENPLEMYLSDCFTVPANLAGLPAISCPCGFDANGMPIGFQLIGKAFAEAELLSAVKAFQIENGFHQKKPSLFSGGERI